jgi:hypothetical protein
MRSISVAAAVFSISLAVAGTASATAIYSYQGNNYVTVVDKDPPAGTYTTSMSIAGSFTLATPLSPNLNAQAITSEVLSFWMDDGRTTVTDATAASHSLTVSTDALGNITDWQWQSIDDVVYDYEGDQSTSINSQKTATFTQDLGQLNECISFGSNCLGAQGDQASNVNNAGTWTLIPEPGTGILVMTGLLGLAACRMRGAL